MVIFKLSGLPCQHVIVVCYFSHLELTTYIHPIYSLNTINKAYELQFHLVKNKDYWSTYTEPNFIQDPHTCHKAPGRPTTNRIHNEMDQPDPNKGTKCSYYRNEGYHRGNCPYRHLFFLTLILNFRIG